MYQVESFDFINDEWSYIFKYMLYYLY